MTIKGNYDTERISEARTTDDLLNDRLMAAMHSVVCTNG
jgi:hypothetical protein